MSFGFCQLSKNLKPGFIETAALLSLCFQISGVAHIYIYTYIRGPLLFDSKLDKGLLLMKNRVEGKSKTM